MKKVRIVYNSKFLRWMCKWNPFAPGLVPAMAWKNSIHILGKKGSISPTLLWHEYFHIQQFRRDGFLTYMIKWHYWTWKYGYSNNPYEIEARNYSLRKVYGKEVI